MAALVNHFTHGPMSVYKLEDIVNFVNKAILGTYGNPHRLDIPTVIDLFERYDRERLQEIHRIREAEHHSIKEIRDESSGKSDRELYREAAAEYLKTKSTQA